MGAVIIWILLQRPREPINHETNELGPLLYSALIVIFLLLVHTGVIKLKKE